MTPTPPDPAAEAVERPITMQDVRLRAGEGKLSAAAVLAACNAELAARYRAAPIPTPEPTEAQVERVARIVADELGDSYDAAFENKSDWIDARGGEPFRDAGMPRRPDYRDAARAAIAAMAPGESCKETGPFLCTTPEAVKPLYTSEPDEAMVERVARAIAEAGHIDLSMAIGHAGGIVAAVRQADAFDDRDPRFRDWSIPQARGVVIYARAALTAAAMPAGEITYEVWQDDMMVAGADSEAHARHYLAMYAQDGPATLYRVETRRSALADLGGGK